MKHSEISSNIENLLNNETEIKNLERKYNIDKLKMDLSYNPCIQSGGQYDMK